MPSENLLLRWVNNDPSLSQDTISALENDPVAQVLYADLKNPSVANDEVVRRAFPLRSSFNDLSVSAPSPGQIVLIDEIVGPEGSMDWDLPNPLAVLVDEPTVSKNVWYGWVVASETDYASYWDMLLVPEDHPFDPLAGMIQIWNPVLVYLPSEVSVLAVLKPDRFRAVHALAVEFVSGVEPDVSLCCPGYVASRETVGGCSVVTGSPLGGCDDPRHRYRKLYHTAVEVLREVARGALSEAEQVDTLSWFSAFYDRLKSSVIGVIQKWDVSWASPVVAMAVVVVLVVSLTFFWPTSFEQIDITFQAIYAQKTVEMEQGLRDFQFEWEKTNVFAFSSSAALPARSAFGAGLLTAREALLGVSEVVLPERFSPPAPFDSWSKSEWVGDFELGRWLFLLWTACHFEAELPQSFWDEQRKILSSFKVKLGENGVIIESLLERPRDCDKLGILLKKIMAESVE
ncbi:MAG: hypothetical protein ABFS56_08745 [Pseudomonadota bacterium]